MRMQDINTGVNWGAEVILERVFPTQVFFQAAKIGKDFWIYSV